MSQNKGEENAVAIVHRALELGVTFIDTAEGYGTEGVVGKALAGPPDRRESVILSTKVSPRSGDVRRTREQIGAAIDAGLERLQTDYIDILNLHGVGAAEYDYCVSEQLPALAAAQDAGKIRCIGITEAFAPDPQHRMLTRAVQDDCWDVMMVGFNLINQSARERVFPTTRAKGIGVLDMFAVRRALGSPTALQQLLQELSEQGKLDLARFDADAPLGFLLTSDGAAENLPDAAYRFCREEPGVHVVLSGTGSIDHLEANVASLERPPLSEASVQRLRELFAGIDSVSGN